VSIPFWRSIGAFGINVSYCSQVIVRLASVAVVAAAVSVVPWRAAATVTSGPPVAWVGTWAAAQVAPAATGLSHTGFRDATVRDIVHISAGGSEVRIRLSNVFGSKPLTINAVRVAVRRSGVQTVAGSSHQATFGGADKVTIPVGKREFSDPVKMSVGAGQDLAVSIFVQAATGPATWHPAAIATSYYSTAGNHSGATGAAAVASYPGRIGAWYFLDGVDVVNQNIAGAVVTFGASTTDGAGSTADANERYPDDLARRLLGLPDGQRLSVLNAGISANQLLVGNGTSGQSALSRFYRDAIDQSGVRAIVIWEGSNDIGDHPGISASRLIDAYRRLINEAHAGGIAAIGATLQPDQGAAYYTPQGDKVRNAVNRWIKASGAFDAVFNFDAVLRDPQDPAELLPAYDSGDHLHPNDAGYQAIADSIALRPLKPGR
jgi:lysophospholipase L1-like esterase